jgi:MscS family membrane protein
MGRRKRSPAVARFTCVKIQACLMQSETTPMNPLMKYFESSSDMSVWLVQVFVVVLITVTVNFLVMRGLDTVQRLSAKTRSQWDDALVSAARLPVRLFAWVWGLSVAAHILQGVSAYSVFDYAPQVRQVAIIAVIAMFLVRLVRNAEGVWIDPERGAKAMDQTTARAIGKLLRLSVIITAVLVVLQTLGYSISGVLAFGGIGGIAVGFAAKDLLANFFGGMMIYLDRPFQVGDWVRSPDRQIEGTVEDIGWRLTRIRTFDQRPLYIPNATFATIAVENPSRMTHRRISETFGLRYADGHKMAAICDDVRAMLKAHPELDPSQTQIVHFVSYGASSLDFMVYCFTKTTQWVHFHAVKEDVLLQIMAIVHRHEADFAFPTRTLHVEGVLQQEATVQL